MRTKLYNRASLITGTVLMALCMLMSLSYGQEVRGNREEEEKSCNCLRIANLLELGSEIETIEKMQKKKRWEDLVSFYEQLVKSTEGKLVECEDGVYRQADEYLRERMVKLEPQAREIYRIKNDRAAQRAFRAASADMDEKAILDVLKFYPLSTYADNALDLLAAINAERGDFEAALEHIERLLDWYEDADVDREELLIRAGWYSYYAGMPNKSEKYLGMVSSDDGKKIENAARYKISRLGELLEKASRRGDKEVRCDEFMEGIPGGGFDRSGVPADIDIGEDIFWRGSFSNITKSTHKLRRTPFRNNKRRRAATPGVNDYRYQSVSYGEFVYSQTEMGLNIYQNRSGRLLMELDAPDESEFFPGMDTYLAPTVTEESIYVNFIYDISDSEDYNGILVKAALPRYTLCAYDRKTGKLKWAAHREREFNRQFAGKWYSIPCAPVIYDNFVIVEVKIRSTLAGSYIVALDRETGELQWATPLCSNGTELTMFGYDARSPLSTMPALSLGAFPTVYCCSNLGAVFALDARTGTVKWANTYEEIPLRAASGYNAQLRDIVWVNTPPVYSDGVLVVTPLDSPNAYAFDAETGKKLWETESDRSGMQLRQFTGIARDKAIFSGSRVVAVDAKTGKLKWSSGSIGATEGGPRGLVTESQVLISQRSGLSVFSLDTGKLVYSERSRERRKEGNLQETNGRLMVTGHGLVTVYKNSRGKNGK